MIVEAEVTIQGSRSAVWAAITDIEDAAEILSGVERVEVRERPAHGLVGLRWRETRILFGEPATVEKWITGAAESEYYETRAEDKGFVFVSTLRLSESPGGTTLTSTHDSRPQSLVARFFSTPMMFFFKGATKKALLQDLNDIKAAVEKTREASVRPRPAHDP